MRLRSKEHVVMGATCATMGAVLLGAGATRPSLLMGAFLDTPLWVLALTAGLVLALAGSMILMFTFRRVDEAVPDVLAHVAFQSRMTIPQPISAALAGANARPAPKPSAPVPRLPAPAAAPRQRVAPPKEDMVVVDAQIRDLTKKINKAGVMLATGQLSQQGYLAYVEDLKRQRGKLEAVRVRHELRS